jgi:hypothetical protein
VIVYAPGDVADLERQVLAKTDFFRQAQVWPRSNAIDPRGWLENFLRPEREHALHLLDAFVYFGASTTNALLIAAIQNLSRDVVANDADPVSAVSRWAEFFDDITVSYITGEHPSPTDSGQKFARAVRDIVGVAEGRILEPGKALEKCARTRTPMVLVDDFLGSGNQCADTWSREYSTQGGKISFESLATGGVPITYVPLVSTELGLARVQQRCKGLTVQPVHVLPATQNIIKNAARYWPVHLAPTAVDFVRIASLRAGIPDTGGASVDDWQGFCRLGLAFGFEHKTPDASLAIFRWSANSWRPLVRAV